MTLYPQADERTPGDAPPHLSLIIPAYNEEARLEATLKRVCAYLDAQPWAAEIIIVDDGSTDGTRQVGERAFAHHCITEFHHHPRNRGKGYAVRGGMLDALGRYRVFYDADGSTPIEELEKLWPRFEAGADIVIGSRALAASDIQVRQAWYREGMGRVFNALLRLLRLTPYRDTQCGFKGFTAAAAQAVFPRQHCDGFAFDAEVLYIAARLGLRIDEVPVRWLNCEHTRLDPVRHSAHMFLEVLRIRLRAWAGRYRAGQPTAS